MTTLWEPQLPYAGTSGWSGTDTSETRALIADATGKTGENQQKTVRLIAQAKTRGLTWQELSASTGWHHGTASGCLSVLHKVGVIVRLVDRRNRCKIYVMEEFINGRECEMQGRPQKNLENARGKLWSAYLDSWDESRGYREGLRAAIRLLDEMTE